MTNRKVDDDVKPGDDDMAKDREEQDWHEQEWIRRQREHLRRVDEWRKAGYIQ